MNFSQRNFRIAAIVIILCYVIFFNAPWFDKESDRIQREFPYLWLLVFVIAFLVSLLGKQKPKGK